jgi:hypothetical protein
MPEAVCEMIPGDMHLVLIAGVTRLISREGLSNPLSVGRGDAAMGKLNRLGAGLHGGSGRMV